MFPPFPVRVRLCPDGTTEVWGVFHPLAPKLVHVAYLLLPDADGGSVHMGPNYVNEGMLMARSVVNCDWKASLTKSSSSQIGHTEVSTTERSQD